MANRKSSRPATREQAFYRAFLRLIPRPRRGPMLATMVKARVMS